MRSYDESKQIELISLLNQARDEIEQLRRINERLVPYERTLAILERAMCGPARSSGAAADVVWRIQKALRLLEEEKAKANPPQQTAL